LIDLVRREGTAARDVGHFEDAGSGWTNEDICRWKT
jgi:hypothetical protein